MRPGRACPPRGRPRRSGSLLSRGRVCPCRALASPTATDLFYPRRLCPPLTPGRVCPSDSPLSLFLSPRRRCRSRDPRAKATKVRSWGPGGPGWEREDPAAARGRVSLKSAGRGINSATWPGLGLGIVCWVMSVLWGSGCVPWAECGVLELADVRYIPGFGSKYF